jgi:topoisomerase IV subunit B
MAAEYKNESIITLEWHEHIRRRPGMYIGKTGDGSSPDDGIYVLVKEIIDNSIDEFIMGSGRKVDVKIEDHRVCIRDYGRGIPLGKVVDCVSKINTGGKYDSEAFQKSVGLNGVGTKAVNALSTFFSVRSFRDGQVKSASFCKGILSSEDTLQSTSERNGTEIIFEPDESIFRNFRFRPAFLEEKIWNYAYLNTGLSIHLNGKIYKSDTGLLDLLQRHTDDNIRYPIIHLKDDDIEVSFTHADHYGEHYFSFVNGQHTTQGGTHQAAFREALVKTVRDFYKKDFDPGDVRTAIIAAVSVRIQEPIFESQTKTKLGSLNTAPEGKQGQSLRSWIGHFMQTHLDNYLHKNPAVADGLLKRIQQSERERKEIAGIKKLANDRAKKANLHNKKLRDCKVHLPDKDHRKRDTMIFITEGDSASGSITKARDVQTQAVFSLKGKPLNTHGLTKKIVYENEEFNLLQHALDIETGLDNLRYEKVVIATDADVDGMHIRLLLLTFFIQFFPELVEQGHVHILQTPLFRVRNKKETRYCYSDEERLEAVRALGPKPEITRFKGLGEISPKEFEGFIRPGEIRLDQVFLPADSSTKRMLAYYMGKNTPDRQVFIMDNLRADAVLDVVEG